MSAIEPSMETMRNSEGVLIAQDVCVDFVIPSGLFGARRSKVVHAVQNVSFSVLKGSCFAIVGESGSGKSTLARALVGLYKPTSGRVNFHATDVGSLDAKALRQMRRRVQMVLQDPRAAIDPRFSVRDVLYEALKVHDIGCGSTERNDRIEAVIKQVGLSTAHLNRFANELSGGQRQRVAIARAVICEPEVLVLDEPVSALDVSVQAQIINLLIELQDRLGLTYVLITHDLSLVGHMADFVGVMYLGRFVEQGPARSVVNAPSHPYTASLLSVVAEDDPVYEKRRKVELLEGSIPSPLALPTGCVFHTRCAHARRVASTMSANEIVEVCGQNLPRSCVERVPPETISTNNGPKPDRYQPQLVSCHYSLDAGNAEWPLWTREMT